MEKCIEPNAFGNALGSSLAEKSSGIERSTYQRNPLEAISLQELTPLSLPSASELLTKLPQAYAIDEPLVSSFAGNEDDILDDGVVPHGPNDSPYKKGAKIPGSNYTSTGVVNQGRKMVDALGVAVPSGFPAGTKAVQYDDHISFQTPDGKVYRVVGGALPDTPSASPQENSTPGIGGSVLDDYDLPSKNWINQLPRIPSIDWLRNAAANYKEGPQLVPWDGVNYKSQAETILENTRWMEGGTFSVINQGAVRYAGGSEEAAQIAGAFGNVADSVSAASRFRPQNTGYLGPRTQLSPVPSYRNLNRVQNGITNVRNSVGANGTNGASRVPGQYLESFKPSSTPVQLVQQQAGRPTVTADVRYDHILDGGINTLKDGSKVGTGGHYLRSPTVRVTAINGTADANGVTTGKVEIRDPATGRWVPKSAETTFYPEGWSKRQVIMEIEGAFQNSIPNPANRKQWVGISPSGIPIVGYYGRPAGTGATAWPVYGARK